MAILRRQCCALAITIATLADAGRLSAGIVGIEYYDRGVVNPEFAGGPLWAGYVDTTANTLTIEHWTELPLHGSEFWMPASLPMVWPARTATGDIYDVPDTFDGRINNDFAFISDLTLRQMEWEQPVFDYKATPPTLEHAIAVAFTLTTIEIRPGWGGWAAAPPSAAPGQWIYLTANPLQTTNPDNSNVQPTFDEHIMPVLPVQATATTWSTEATVIHFFSDISAVPEAGAWLFLLVALTIAGAAALRRRA